jgi:nucleoside-diphosphate-sugar epimerase
MKSSGKILLTGSSGWLGRHLSPMLQETGYEVVGLDPAPGEFTDVIGGVEDKPLITDLFSRHRFDGVVHGGALHKPDIARYDKQDFVDVNVTGTLNILTEASLAKVSRFVFTSTTSLMISQSIRKAVGDCVWLDELSGPLEPRNIYGVTKLAAEGLCRQAHIETGLPIIVLRTARFFPEDDDTLKDLTGPNLKANELLNRRASVRDICRAHLKSLSAPDNLGFRLYLVSAPTPFSRSETSRLKNNAKTLILNKFPDAEMLYTKQGWMLPDKIDRVYDGGSICRELGFRYETSFNSILEHISSGSAFPLEHDPDYISPLEQFMLPNRGGLITKL